MYKASLLWTVLIAAAAFRLVTILPPAPVGAEPGPAFCSNLADTFQGDWEINSSDLSLADKAGVRKGLRQSALDLTRVSHCSPGAARDYANAYEHALHAAQLHAIDDDGWKSELNLANQLLEKCVTRFYGTGKSAQCETDLETNIHRKTMWSNP